MKTGMKINLIRRKTMSNRLPPDVPFDHPRFQTDPIEEEIERRLEENPDMDYEEVREQVIWEREDLKAE